MNGFRIMTILLAVMLLSVAAAQGEQPRRGADATKPKEAKVPGTAFSEIERHKNYSVVAVTVAPGTAAPPSMFVLKGCYEMAKRRGAAYFVTLREWQDAKGNWDYVVGFSPDDRVDPATFFGVPVDPGKKLMFKSVKDYDLLWSTGR
jgi:hypothetical protein